MTNFGPNNAGPFRLGAPTRPARRDHADVDPFAERAVRTLADTLEPLRWTPPQQGIAVYGDRDQWRVQFIVPLVTNPFVNPDDRADGVEVDQLLAQDGRTPLVNEVRRTLWSEPRSVNATAILGNQVVFHWLMVEAIYEQGLPDDDAICEWLLDETGDGGVGMVYPVIVDLAIRDYVARNHVETGPRNEWERHLAREVTRTAFSFRSGVFESDLRRLVDDYTIRRGPLEQIRQADQALGLQITPAQREYLVRYFEQSGLTLNNANRNTLVSGALLQQRSSSISMMQLTDSALAPLDFAVTYHTDTVGTAAVNTNNVRCAAQLFYVMTLGDELGVFRAADLLVMRHLSLGRVDISSPQLLRDLQDYALNEEFRGAQGRVLQRTSEEERRMFYRQVFDLGDAQLVDGMVTNREFAHLWNNLMLETVRYIEKVEHSERPAEFVSRSPIGRLLEDLQYNLSTHSSGMAKIMAPVMYQELDFVIEHLFKNSEIIDQLALHNTGSYWRVIERILHEDQHHSINITALQKKAQLGHQILTAVADHTEARVADDGAFSTLVSQIEAFIIAGEQLETEPGSMFDRPAPVPAGAGAAAGNGHGYGNGNGYGSGNGQSDWSF